MRCCPMCGRSYDDSVAACPEDDSPLLPSARILPPGTVLRGKYTIVEELGRGGMAAVYRARHIVFGEDKALKVLLDETNALQRDAFRAEAVLLRSLKHPNIVQVEDIDATEDGELFVVMELIEGETLAAYMARKGPLPPAEALAIAADVCEALRFSHSRGVLHRDIKPHNVVLQVRSDGATTAKVIDFGIAKVKEAARPVVSGMLTSATGYFLGTPEYASPEQILGMKGDDLDGRTDIYSLGVVLYRALTGRLPFLSDTMMSRLGARFNAPPPAPPHILRPDLNIGAEV